MLSTTADSTAPAALAPSISTCSTCKGDQLTGPSVRLPGPRPAPPLPHHSLQELACLGGSHHIFPKMLQPRETWTSQDCPRWTSEAAGSPFLQEATWALSSLPPSEPFSPGSACSVTLRWAQPLSPLFDTKGAREVGRGAPLDTAHRDQFHTDLGLGLLNARPRLLGRTSCHPLAPWCLLSTYKCS